MEYIKLIALDIGDLYSRVFFEDNYNLSERDKAMSQKKDLEKKGYYCVLLNTNTNTII